MHREVIPLETVWDSDEALVVLADYRLLDLGSMGILGVVTPTIKMALQNPSRLLTSRGGLIIRRTVPLRHRIHRGLHPISPRTSPPRHDLQNNKKSNISGKPMS